MPSGLAAPERVLVADVDLPPARYPAERIFALAQNLLQRLQAEPGTRSAALMTSVPLDPRPRAEFGFTLEGGEPYPPGQSPKAEMLWTTPGYLATMGIPLVRGRDLIRRLDHLIAGNKQQEALIEDSGVYPIHARVFHGVKLHDSLSWFHPPPGTKSWWSR